MKILVIVVTYNAMPWIERCLGNLRSSSIKPDIFVVDNGSSDGTQNYIRVHFPEVLFYQSKDNLGFGKANNIGLQYALVNGYDYSYLLNQDAWVFPNTLEKLIDISKRHPEYGILSPMQMEANMEHLDTNFKKNVCKWQSSPNLLDDLYLQKKKEVIPVYSVMAAHWLVTSDCLMKTGGFSPSFPHYGEDDNYQHRAIYHGFKIGIVPSLQVVHDREKRKTTKQQTIYMQYIYCLRLLSNPSVKIWKGWVFSLYSSLKSVVIFRSVFPLWNFMKVVFDGRTILRNRRTSIIVERAFLN